MLLQTSVENESETTIEFWLDESVFNIRRLQARSRLAVDRLLDLQYADDCVLVVPTPEVLQAALSAVADAYRRMGSNYGINVSLEQQGAAWTTIVWKRGRKTNKCACFQVPLQCPLDYVLHRCFFQIRSILPCSISVQLPLYTQASSRGFSIGADAA